jgi:hypothetical protein
LRGAEHFKVALDFFQRALNTHRWLGNPVKVAIDFESMDFVFETQGHYQEALQLKKQYGSPQDIAITEQNIARVKRQM